MVNGLCIPKKMKRQRFEWLLKEFLKAMSSE